MIARMTGTVTSFRTPWPRFNAATTDGIEWHSTNVIAGRPGAGKTLMQDQIIREGFILNKTQKFRVLKFEFEMLARTSAIREYSSHLGKSYKYLCSADGGPITKEDLKRCEDYARSQSDLPIDIIDKSVTVEEFMSIVVDYMDTHAEIVDGKKVYTNTLITIDHSILFEKAKTEKDKMDMLYNLGSALTALKKPYPIAFIVLSQLSRAIENPERNESGKYGNYVLESDIFGADALLQHADFVVGINRPWKYNVKKYGPDKYIIQDDRVLVMHVLKARNGNTGMSFMRSEYDKMRIVETEAPPRDKINF